MSTDCTFNTPDMEMLATNITFDAKTLLQASVEGINIPTEIALPESPPDGWTVPPGYTLPWTLDLPCHQPQMKLRIRPIKLPTMLRMLQTMLWLQLGIWLRQELRR